MKILIVTNKYLPDSNGDAERSISEFVVWAKNAGHDMFVISSGDYDYFIDGIKVKRISKISDSKLKSEILKIRPDVCICQLDWTPITVRVCNLLKIPVIHSSRVGDFNENADAWIFNNKLNAKYWSSKFSLDKNRVHVCYPLVRKVSNKFFNKDIKKFITIVNPVRAKGGEIFEKLVKEFSKEIFIGVHGWHDPQLDGVNLTHQNLLYLDRQKNMNIIFEQTKVLLVLSIWDDPSPRVILEAASYGIPIVASKKGGIVEFVHDEDMLFNVNNGNEAKEILRKLLYDKDFYDKKVKQMKKISNKYEMNKFLPEMLKFVESVTLKDKYIPNYKQEFVNMEWFTPRYEK